MRTIPAVLPRFALVALAFLLASAAVTLAADRVTAPPKPAAPPQAPAAPAALVVPDVRNHVYVFAKGTLEDAGFAWKVVGAVDGYAANLVAEQSPAPGTRLVDTGAPLVTLTLKRNPDYRQEGEPDNSSPYPGTKLSLAELAVAPAAPVAEPAPAPAAKPKPGQKRKAKQMPAKRPPAFAVPGVPPEPLDEIPLDERARRLAAWVEKHPSPSDANVRHWLYQHAWIVTGARFGWWHGAQALEVLIGVDRRVEELWGVGAKSRGVAESALAEVRRKAR